MKRLISGFTRSVASKGLGTTIVPISERGTNVFLGAAGLEKYGNDFGAVAEGVKSTPASKLNEATREAMHVVHEESQPILNKLNPKSWHNVVLVSEKYGKGHGGMTFAPMRSQGADFKRMLAETYPYLTGRCAFGSFPNGGMELAHEFGEPELRNLEGDRPDRIAENPDRLARYQLEGLRENKIIENTVALGSDRVRNRHTISSGDTHAIAFTMLMETENQHALQGINNWAVIDGNGWRAGGTFNFGKTAAPLSDGLNMDLSGALFRNVWNRFDVLLEVIAQRWEEGVPLHEQKMLTGPGWNALKKDWNEECTRTFGPGFHSQEKMLGVMQELGAGNRAFHHVFGDNTASVKSAISAVSNTATTLQPKDVTQVAPQPTVTTTPQQQQQPNEVVGNTATVKSATSAVSDTATNSQPKEVEQVAPQPTVTTTPQQQQQQEPQQGPNLGQPS